MTDFSFGKVQHRHTGGNEEQGIINSPTPGGEIMTEGERLNPSLRH
jgi:hypothetical protein